MKAQLTLGKLIDKLKKQDPTHTVQFGFGFLRPTELNSYRGYYNQLALDYSEEGQITVAELLALLQDAVGKEFTGYKGGDYEMTLDTPVWASRYNEASSTAIVGVKDRGWFTQLKTAYYD